MIAKLLIFILLLPTFLEISNVYNRMIYIKNGDWFHPFDTELIGDKPPESVERKQLRNSQLLLLVYLVIMLICIVYIYKF